ncbi:MAG: pyridoxamine 5'-phosphate oxidase family protein [Pseudomonadota bacterium]
MGKEYAAIDDDVWAWVARQHMFFVSTAPRADDGLVNCSPKGVVHLRRIDERTLAYLDYGGSGVETIAHLRENGRIVIMLCAFEGPPKIFRFYGRGEAMTPDRSEFEALAELFDAEMLGVRSIIRIDVTRIADSCGYGVPRYDFVDQRPSLPNYYRNAGVQKMRDFAETANAESLDGLPGLTAAEAAATSPGFSAD